MSGNLGSFISAGLSSGKSAMVKTSFLTKNLTIVFFVLTLTSCSLFSGRETAGEYVDDTAITAKVKGAFVADPQVKSTQVNVETMQGVVQLSGFVDTQAIDQRAVQLAEQVHGVKLVKDNIIIRSSH
jgi:osmotically-inducible protein OsmY